MQEQAPRRSGSFCAVLLIVVFGFIVLSLPGWIEKFETIFDLPYVTSVYQLVIFILISISILFFLRHYAVSYQYLLTEDAVSVREQSGARITEVFRGKISCDTQVLSYAEGMLYLKENGLRGCRFGVIDKECAYFVTFPGSKANSVLIFQPSNEFVKLLQQKVLDKRAEM